MDKKEKEKKIKEFDILKAKFVMPTSKDTLRSNVSTVGTNTLLVEVLKVLVEIQYSLEK